MRSKHLPPCLSVFYLKFGAFAPELNIVLGLPSTSHLLLFFGDTAVRGEGSLLSKILIIIMHAICKTSLPRLHVACKMLESVTPLKLHRVVISHCNFHLIGI